MSNVIDFLERMGQDSELRHASGASLERALRDARVNASLHAALMSGNRASLEAVLGADCNVCCLINSPTQEEEEKKPQKTKEDSSATGQLRLTA